MCARTLETTGLRPLELSGSKDGVDEDEQSEVRRVEVLNEVQSSRRTVAAAASVLGISERQAIPAPVAVPGERRVRAGAQGTWPDVEPES